MVEEQVVTQNQIQLSNAERFYLNCNLKNPKDIWNKITFVDNSNFDFTKTNSLLNQKSKNFFGLEKKKGFTIKCFGFIYSGETAFKNCLNRKPEDLGLILPRSFQELEEFTGASNLQVFKCLDMEAINYETNAVHLSAHMFFERTEVKQKLNMILQDFAFKSGTNKKVLKLCTTLNKKAKEDTTAIASSSVELGFVDKFVEVFRLRTRLNKISADVTEKKWSKQ